MSRYVIVLLVSALCLASLPFRLSETKPDAAYFTTTAMAAEK